MDGARCQFAIHAQTSTETGGDWCTIIHTPHQHVTTAVIADVTGHGAPAALVTAILHGFFKAVPASAFVGGQAEWRTSVEGVLQRLNTTMIESTRRSLMCSLWESFIGTARVYHKGNYRRDAEKNSIWMIKTTIWGVSWENFPNEWK